MIIVTRLRSSQEILQRFLSRKDSDPLGFEVNEYIPYMSFKDAHAAGILNPEITAEEFAKITAAAGLEYTHEKLLDVMLKYMPFAWEKANGCRGISAIRSLNHYAAWIWLTGDDDFLKELETVPYEHYGKEQLVTICQHYGWDSSQWDDGRRVNSDME